MTPKPLGEIGLLDHRSALWWLGLLHRKPKQFEESLAGLNRGQALLTGIGLYLHSLPYSVFNIK